MVNAMNLQRIAAAVVFAALISGADAAAADNYEDGVLAYSGGNFARALDALEPLLTRGHAGAEMMVGVMHLRGQGYRQDEGTAAVWMYKAARKGESGAQLVLGSQFLFGRGVGQDLVRALTWLTLAAESPIVTVAEQAAIYREEAAVLMTADEISRARRNADGFSPVPDRFVDGE